MSMSSYIVSKLFRFHGTIGSSWWSDECIHIFLFTIIEVGEDSKHGYQIGSAMWNQMYVPFNLL